MYWGRVVHFLVLDRSPSVCWSLVPHECVELILTRASVILLNNGCLYRIQTYIDGYLEDSHLFHDSNLFHLPCLTEIACNSISSAPNLLPTSLQLGRPRG